MYLQVKHQVMEALFRYTVMKSHWKREKRRTFVLLLLQSPTESHSYFKVEICQYHLQQGLGEERSKIWALVLIIINYVSLTNYLSCNDIYVCTKFLEFTWENKRKIIHILPGRCCRNVTENYNIHPKFLGSEKVYTSPSFLLMLPLSKSSSTCLDHITPGTARWTL